MFEITEVPRVDVKGDQEEVRRLVRSGTPFIITEYDNEEFQRFREEHTLERFRQAFGSREWTVQCGERGKFEPEVPFAHQTARMPFSEFLDKVERPDERLQHYLNLWVNPAMEEELKSLFSELLELSPKLALTRYDRQQLLVYWIGGAGTVTPLHYDTYARSHGVLHGKKLFWLFPPDLRHYRKLDPFPIWSPVGWYSKIAGGPIDPEKFPQLSGTRPHRALCGPGDFLYLPPCWWHHVSIPDEPTLTISATYTPRRAMLYWYHWRMRLTRWLAGQDRLLKKVGPRQPATA